jgi:hypothetical protein
VYSVKYIVYTVPSLERLPDRDPPLPLLVRLLLVVGDRVASLLAAGLLDDGNRPEEPLEDSNRVFSRVPGRVNT